MSTFASEFIGGILFICHQQKWEVDTAEKDQPSDVNLLGVTALAATGFFFVALYYLWRGNEF
jgi:hypothetical protein